MQIDSASKEEIEAATKDLRESLTSEDAAENKAKTERLQAAFHKVTEAMYERAQAEQQQAAGNGAGADGEATGSGSGSGDAEEEVVDAEVVDEQR